MNRDKQQSLRPMDALQAMVWVILCSVAVAALMGVISPVGLAQRSLLANESHGLIPLLNWLPVALLMLLGFFVLGNAAAAVGVVGIVMLCMAAANRVKIQLRGDPLLHWDLTMIGEMLGVARGFWSLAIAVIIGFVLLVLAAVWLIRRVCTAPLPWRTRLAGMLMCLLVMLGLNTAVYRNSRLYHWLPVHGTVYNQTDVHNSRGNLYAFLYNWNTYRAVKPEGYERMQAAQFADQQAAAMPTPAVRPNIIVIMGEAVCDISESPLLDFSKHRDPLAGHKRLVAAGVSGHIVVPGRGGGTADTEADVLTGLPTRYLRCAPYAYRLIGEPLPALPSMLKQLGYASFALHPGYPWFYNRQNVYPWLGFDRSIFADSFSQDAYLDWYISEEATYDRFIDEIDAHLSQSPDTPLFAFCLTIQNHGPYPGRYLPADTVNFETSLSLSADETAALANYFHGLADADDQLIRLAEYLDEQSEPFVLMTFGDHLPSLDERLFDLLMPGADAPDGSFAQQTRLNTTPFLIWQNKAAQAQCDIMPHAAEAAMPQNGTISSNYLGGYLLELLGYDGLSAYMDYSNAVRAEYPVLMEKLAFDVNEQPHAQGDDPRLEKLRHWVYWQALDQ